MSYRLKQVIGAIILDRPLFEWRLRSSWTHIRNRNDRIETGPDGRGVACRWQWTSDLYVTKVFPALGPRLLARCTQAWPIAFAPAPEQRAGAVDVSFVIGHRGMERVPLLLSSLATVAAQSGVNCECVVVEQSSTSEVREFLPAWVRHVHTPPPVPGLPYCRSWALNVGARASRGKLLVFHDGDMLIPRSYASELWSRAQSGYEVINLKRFVFYLTDAHSRAICAGNRNLLAMPAIAIVQNLEAGGSVAVSRDAFLAIGGYDEAFIGWGGEDNEFWERAQTRRVWPYAYLPIVHLWHPAQPHKADSTNPNLRRQRERATHSTERRIAELSAREFGQTDRLSVDWIAP